MEWNPIEDLQDVPQREENMGDTQDENMDHQLMHGLGVDVENQQGQHAAVDLRIQAFGELAGAVRIVDGGRKWRSQLMRT